MIVIYIDAIEEYNELKLELSRVSRISSIPASKLEEGKSDEEEFNLSSYLHDMSIDNREAGQKFEHLGVIWKNVTVEVT